MSHRKLGVNGKPPASSFAASVLFRRSAWSILIFCLSAPLGLGQVWEPVPLRTPVIKTSGPGGEGCQVCVALAVDATEGRTLFLGTDVGGVYRSIDGGLNWMPSNSGLNARGACAFAIDPRNPDRVLLTACNSLVRPENGLYLSKNRGATWKQVKPLRIQGNHDMREQIAFDPTSFDAAQNRTCVIYWSSENTDGAPGALYKSVDGGETWNEVNHSDFAGSCSLKVHPTTGWLYAGAKERGLGELCENHRFPDFAKRDLCIPVGTGRVVGFCACPRYRRRFLRLARNCMGMRGDRLRVGTVR